MRRHPGRTLRRDRRAQGLHAGPAGDPRGQPELLLLRRHPALLGPGTGGAQAAQRRVLPDGRSETALGRRGPGRGDRRGPTGGHPLDQYTGGAEPCRRDLSGTWRAGSGVLPPAPKRHGIFFSTGLIEARKHVRGNAWRAGARRQSLDLLRQPLGVPRGSRGRAHRHAARPGQDRGLPRR